MNILPPARPKQTRLTTEALLEPYGSPEIALLAYRGYYRDTLGIYGKNDRKIFDDAIFFISPKVYRTFNVNTDPNGFRQGHGTAESTKGMASLKPGKYPYKLGMHKGQYKCLVQAGPVTVYRDADDKVPESKVIMHQGIRAYEDTGEFGIHVHHAGHTSTSSLGCITLPPEQYDEFIDLVESQMALSGVTEIPLVLVEKREIV